MNQLYLSGNLHLIRLLLQHEAKFKHNQNEQENHYQLLMAKLLQRAFITILLLQLEMLQTWRKAKEIFIIPGEIIRRANHFTEPVLLANERCVALYCRYHQGPLIHLSNNAHQGAVFSPGAPESPQQPQDNRQGL